MHPIETKIIDAKPSVIGIAGTAKNTGKTTTLNILLREATRRNLLIAITGIGFDGEEIDNVTLLPKPRVTVYPHSIVTTSEQCLDISTAKVEILQRTGMFTSLGEILILRVIQQGLIVIAGPSKKKELQTVISKMAEYNVDVTFVDGSLNRISPMSVVSNIIFTTGASRSIDINELSNEMHAIEYFFQPPISAYDEDLNSTTIEIKLLLDKVEVNELKSKWIHKNDGLYISNLISTAALAHLTACCLDHSISIQRVIFSDPFMLMINGNISETYKHICDIRKLNISIAYKNIPKLSCITANPFFPQIIGNKYFSRFVDKGELIHQLQLKCSTPIFNTQETESSIIFDTCFN